MSITTIGGMKLDLRPNTSDLKAATHNLIDLEYEKFFPIEKGEDWIDLGGYIGAFALRVLQCGGNTISYEPDPENVTCYLKNLKLNGVRHPEDKCIQEAIIYEKSADTAQLIICENKGNFWSNTLINRWKKPRKMIEVPLTSFAEMLNDVPAGEEDCLKIDIEGCEWDILQFAKELEIFRKIIVEMHFYQEKSLDRLRKIIKRLESKGFTVHTDPPIPKQDTWRNPKRHVMNLYAIKE